ncbi:hypothetical protein FA727_23810 [Robertmurraya kyonggiensis]|uniref:Uncharacterized protein n=1 Tax=Robertmurraya kyonggiensis TaxID=1037680 RepID=A0A4U1CT73_9BACI|nr:hypothetical protein FA727_23810 [Robertmurraya kyonggiensis]
MSVAASGGRGLARSGLLRRWADCWAGVVGRKEKEKKREKEKVFLLFKHSFEFKFKFEFNNQK